MRILVLATDPVDAGDVRRALGNGADLDGAEVLVVAPAVNQSPLAFWLMSALALALAAVLLLGLLWLTLRRRR